MPVPDFIVELRRHVGHDPLWLPGATAVVVRDGAAGPEVLLVQRADNHAWTPVTGVVDPGEHPAVTAVRETLEEAGVTAQVVRLAQVAVTPMVRYDNGDQTRYLDHTFRCAWVAGEPYVADDESVDARWWPLAALPEMTAEMLDRIDAAVADEPGTRLPT